MLLVFPFGRPNAEDEYASSITALAHRVPRLKEIPEMIRKLRAAAVPTVAAASLVLTGTGTALAASAPAAHPATTPSVCVSTNKVHINTFTFAPTSVSPGQQSVATLSTSNCTNAALTTTQRWGAQWVAADGSTIAPGCPTVAQVVRTVNYAPNGTDDWSVAYSVPIGCTAVNLTITVPISGPGGTLLVIAVAILTIRQ